MENEKAIEIYNEMKNNASEEDVTKINNKIGKMCKGALKKVWGHVVALVKLLNDKDAAWAPKVIAIGALLYVVSPIDAIPDIIPILGLTDDAAIIGTAVSALGMALNKYIKARQ